MKCQDCKKDRNDVRLMNGRLLCRSCRHAVHDYESHWFVKSLKYHKPDLKIKKQYKSFPGQLDLGLEE